VSAVAGPAAVLRDDSTASRRILVMLGGLYLAQGIPMGFAFEALPVLLRRAGAALELVALVPLAGLPWILKLLWAPWVDNHALGRLGRRRGWMLGMQSLLATCFLLMALLPSAAADAPVLMACLAIGCLAAATQDTATDGLAAERLHGAALAQANALQTGCMMLGFMAGGGGALVISGWLGPRAALLALTTLLLLALLPVLLWREPAIAAPRRASLRLSLGRAGVGLLAVISLLYGTAHAGGMSLSKLLLVDQGWPAERVGAATMVTSLALLLLGCPLGARLTNRLGLWGGMGAGLLAAVLALGAWGVLAVTGLQPGWLTVAPLCLLLGLASGIIAVAASTLAMRFAAGGRQAGTDVSLLQSASMLGEMLAAGLLVWSAASLGYGGAFGLSLLVVLGLLALVRLGARRIALPAPDAQPPP
jgi:RhtX/FptX family siderophore transporter